MRLRNASKYFTTLSNNLKHALIKKRAQKWRSPFLLLVHELSVEGTEKDVDNEVEAEFSTDELVEGALY